MITICNSQDNRETDMPYKSHKDLNIRQDRCTIERITLDQLSEEHLNKDRPFIITNGVNDLNWAATEKWKSLQSFKDNYGDLHINYFGGFQGYMSRFRYYNYAVQPYEIEQICKNGPSSLNDLSNDLTGPPYLSKKYWLNTGFPQANGFP